ncbi:HEAT repeat domain-containing protein [uncultured Gimesia sp.]|uniref:HEAT repeat domain-containing protein n=1 Tax=uncultured Gimesia sp. TaxID=1678688 RepID=UPI002609D546|nr:HEAT repeat domain-containing protein [uncultured Gimesia sp.]
MLDLIPRTNPLFFLMALAFFFTGCGGSGTSSQRQSNSNPYGPSARSNNTNHNRASSQQQTPKLSQKKEQPAVSSPVTPKVMAQKKPEAVKTDPSIPANPTNIISETSKKTLDSKNPGVAIIVRGISGDEPEALPIIQNEIRATFSKPSAGDLTKQEPPAESSQGDVEHFVFNKQLVLVVRPVPRDLFAFAQNLKWGKVKEIDIPNRIITVDTQLTELAALEKTNSTPPASTVKDPVKADAKNSNTNPNSTKPAMKEPDKKSGNVNPLANDRDLKPRPGEETLDWALRVIAGTSSTAHDTACKKLVRMKPTSDQLQRVSTVLATTLPLAKTGFRMKEHVNAMSVWYTDDATMNFSALLSEEKDGLVREEIIKLLPKIRSEVTAEVLVGRLSHRRDKKVAIISLRIMGEIAEKPVIKLLNHPDSSLRIEACKILQSIGTQEAVAALQKLAETEESGVIKQLISETQIEINKKSGTPEK